MKRVRAIAVLPALFTLGNLVCGFFSIVVAARVEPPVAAVETTTRAERRAVARESAMIGPTDPANIALGAALIFLAMVFDAFDGQVARMSRATTDFGGQLDSLCDVVSFGVAPGFLLVKMCPNFTYLHREAIWIIAAAFAACAALRLARFNVETSEEDDHLYFSGLPSPAAAGSVASFAIAFYALRQPDTVLAYANQIDVALQAVLPYYGLLAAVLMVSRIRYPHVVNQLFHGPRTFSHLVRLVFALVAVMAVPFYSVPIICCVFVLSSPLRYLWQAVVLRRPQTEPLF